MSRSTPRGRAGDRRSSGVSAASDVYKARRLGYSEGGGMFDKFHEECGVVGVYGHPEAATLAYLALYALQHRGQESAGIVASNGEALISHRGMGTSPRSSIRTSC